MRKGFTLIEVIIYLALLVIIVGGGLVVVYQIIEGSQRIRNEVVLQEEINFTLRKFEWALTGTPTVTSPAAGNSGNTLILNKNGETLTFNLDGTEHLQLKRDANPPLPFTSSNVKVSSLNVIHSTDSPPEITVQFTISDQKSSQNVELVKYLRQ